MMPRVLHTERLVLREPRPGDQHAAFAGWAQDAEVLRYLGWTPHTRISETQAQLDWAQARWLKRSACTWLLVPRAPGSEPIGLVELLPQQLQGPVFHWRLGYLLGRAHWGQGWMREALAAVLQEAFAHAATRRVDALCDLDNTASARLLEALHFESEGVLRSHTLHPGMGAEPRDVRVYALLSASARRP